MARLRTGKNSFGSGLYAPWRGAYCYWLFFVEKMQLWNTLRTLCQAHWSVNNFCLNWKVCLSWWVVFLLRTFYGFKQFCWLCHHDIVLPRNLNYTSFRKIAKQLLIPPPESNDSDANINYHISPAPSCKTSPYSIKWSCWTDQYFFSSNHV